jgi:hypothetical protein
MDQMMRRVKPLEIAIMLIAAAGFVTAQVGVLLVCVFLMSTYSALYGTVKYTF